MDYFNGSGPGHQLLIKPNETVQYFIEMSGSNEGIARMVLEYTQNGGQRWIIETAQDGTAIDLTGTIADPLLALDTQGFIKNESPKNKVYRWRAVTYDRTNSAEIPCYLSKHELIRGKLKLDDSLFILWDDETPSSGIDGDGAQYAGKGSLYIDTDGGLLYRNDGTATETNWVSV
jgi:hypothetical protein